MPTCQKACQFFTLPCHRVNFSLCRAVPCRANFSNIRLTECAKGNFYTLLLYEKFYIILAIIVTHMMCICIAHKNCIILHFYTSCHIKEKSAEFCFLKLFCSSVKNENTKKNWFLYITSNKSFLEIPQLKQRIRYTCKYCNTCKYCDLLEL